MVEVERSLVKSKGQLVKAVTNAMMATSAMIGTRLRKAVPSCRAAPILMLKWTNIAPSTPPTAPSTRNHGYSDIEGISTKCVWNMVSLPVPVGLYHLSDNAAITAAKKARIMVFCGNMVLTSSYEKSTPPSGVPNATDTPAAAAVLMSSRRLASFCTYREESLEQKFAQQQATWTRGPSLPRLMPEETESVRPMILTTNVLNSKTSFMTNPPRIVFTSGMPLPLAMGAKARTKAADTAAKATLIAT
mmetsp:Transcript_24521/g.62069  ORF Transcript_24521/g.62069 Transcript_24521/m.62069 type:complete len:246 (-) Transcript_24521:3002-3739(-)